MNDNNCIIKDEPLSPSDLRYKLHPKNGNLIEENENYCEPIIREESLSPSDLRLKKYPKGDNVLEKNESYN